MFCYVLSPRARDRDAGPPRARTPGVAGASRRPGSAAELGDGTARWSLAGSEQGAGPGRRGGESARAAAVARWDCCRAAGPVSAAGPAGGRGRSGRARERVGCAAERATWARVPTCPRTGPCWLLPSGPWSECAPRTPQIPHTPNPRSRPASRAAPSSAPRRHPPAPRHARAIVPGLGLAGTRLTL